MVLNSLAFAAFFLIFLAVLLVLPKKLRKTWLLLGNLAFAFTWERWGPVLLILSALLLLFGLIIIINPFWDTPGALLKIIGLMIIFTAIVSALRLIWIWPIRSE